MKLIVSLLLGVSLCGCGSAIKTIRGERSTGSVIQPGERLVITKYVSDQKICAEPPADVASSVFSAIQASLSGSVEDKAQGAAALSSVSNNEIVKLFERSQGIQGLRDGMYRTCEAFINGGIDPKTYGQQMTYMTATLNFLVTVELCGKILDAKDLIDNEANGTGSAARRDLRPEMYKECISAANNAAEKILNTNSLSMSSK